MKWKKIIFIGASLILLLIIFMLWRRSSEEKAGFQEIVVKRGDIQATVLSTGIVQPENRLEIKPPISGRIDEIFVDEGDVIKKGHILMKMSSNERAALVDAARAQSAEELKKWETYYKPAPILAPIDGTIILRNVEPGQTITNNDAALVMSDRLTVKAQVDETDIADISLNQKADVVLDAYPNEVIPARVDKIAYDSKTINNVTTYIVDVLPEETPESMRSGMTSNVTFMLASKQNVLFLPNAAVKIKDNKSIVVMPPENSLGKPVERAVETGLTDGKRIEIVNGLVDGDKVLMEKKVKVRNGSTSSSPFSPFAPRRH